MTPTLRNLYDRCVEEGDCVLWAQACTGQGHPIISLSSEKRGAPVRPLAYCLQHGLEEVPDGLFAYAKCGHKACISPKHLVIGTRSQYMRNASKHGAYSNASKDMLRARAAQKRSRLTWDHVRALRQERTEGATYRELGVRYGISLDMAWRIVRGDCWKESATNSSVFHMGREAAA